MAEPDSPVRNTKREHLHRCQHGPANSNSLCMPCGREHHPPALVQPAVYERTRAVLPKGRQTTRRTRSELKSWEQCVFNKIHPIGSCHSARILGLIRSRQAPGKPAPEPRRAQNILRPATAMHNGQGCQKLTSSSRSHGGRSHVHCTSPLLVRQRPHRQR